MNDTPDQVPPPAPDIAQALTWARSQLPAERSDAEHLLAWLLRRSRASLRARPESRLDDQQWRDYQRLVGARANGQPLAYLTGEREFWSLPMAVGPGVLIPRPETEGLVVAALQRLPPQASGWVADVGCGSANIGVALASERPLLDVLAIEPSPAALPWAQCNIHRYGDGRCRLLRGDLLSAVAPARLLGVFANLPYIAAGDAHLDPATATHEPASALYAESDGLALIARLIEQATSALQPGGWLLLEHGWRQGEAVRQLLQAAGYGEVFSDRDLAGHERVSGGRWPGSGQPQSRNAGGFDR